MNYRIPLLVLALLMGSTTVAQKDKPTLAVIEFEGLGLSEAEVAALTNRLRTHLTQIGQYTVIERGMMTQILQEQDFQLTGCTSDECAVEVGQLLGARYMLAGSIGKVGTTWTVEMRIINVETGAVEKTAFYDIQGSIDLILTDGMAVAAGRISGGGAAVPAAQATVPDEVPDEMIQKLTAPDAQAGDDFGFSVAISGDYAIVGAYLEDTGGRNAGAAYVFRRIGTNGWDSGIKLTAPDAQAGDYFGTGVAISGDYAIVGAHLEDTGGRNAGAAYVFRRIGANGWDSGIKLTAPDAQAGNWFGRSVAISGDYAIVGRDGIEAYIFRRTGANSWDGEIKIVVPDAQAGGWFGTSVALSPAVGGASGDYAIVGAPDEAVYIFRRTGINGWDGGTKIVAPDTLDGGGFGNSVALSPAFGETGGNYAIVGASAEDAGGTEAGAAYVFRCIGTNSWDGGTKLTAPDAQAHDQFGISVAISGDYALVGAHYEDAGGYIAGAAYVFRRTGTNSWDSGVKLTAPDAQKGDQFGHSVAISGDYAIMGARWEDTGGKDAGAVYIFR